MPEVRKLTKRPVATEPVECVSCGGTPTQNAHVVSWLYLVQRGIPARLCDEPWNLVPLCFACHQIYDLEDWDGRHNRGRRQPTVGDREKIVLLRERISGRRTAAEAKLKELCACVRVWEIAIGDDIEGAEVSAFDITQISNRVVRVFTFQPGVEVVTDE